MMKKIGIAALLIGILYGGYRWLSSDSAADIIPEEISNMIPTASTSPQPFSEITIPSLQAREYHSELGERQEYARRDTYTSYLTSYDSDGLKINGLLTIPSGEPPEGGWPAIIFVHGYIPPTLYRTTEKYLDYVDYLARSGFVVFKIDLRGHGSSEGEPGGSYYSADYVVDTLSARSALQVTDFVNPNKIGFWGHSMAGNVTFRALTSARDVPAVVIWAGAVYTYEDFRTYGISDNSYRPPGSDTPARRKRQELLETQGEFSTSSTFWRQVVPTNYLNGITTALQLHHAVDDAVVPIDYSRNLMKVLDSTTLPHELYEYSTGGHNISNPSFNIAMQRTVTFFKEHLK